MLAEVNDARNDCLHGAEGVVTRAPEADKLPSDAVILVCKFEAYKVGKVKQLHRAVKVVNSGMVVMQMYVLEAEGRGIWVF